MGARIGRADYDDLLASFLWVREGQLAREMHQHLEQHRDRVQRELDHAEKREEELYFSTPPVDEDYADIASDTQHKLEKELPPARRACEKSTRLRLIMSEDYGDTEKIRERYTRGTDTKPSLLEDLFKIWDTHIDATLRVDKILASDRDRAHFTALQEAAMMAYHDSPGSFSMDRIRQMHHTEFECTVASLARRDGYVITRNRGGAGDLGADVIAVAPDAQTRVVIQCKHTRGGGTVGSPVLQRLNGTARQVHQADVVVAVTNGYYSAPARTFARSQGIALIDWRSLEHWATWGVPLTKVLTYV